MTTRGPRPKGMRRVERWLEERLPQGVRVERIMVSVEDLRG